MAEAAAASPAAAGKGFANPLIDGGAPARAQAAPPTARALREAGSATDGIVYACFFVPGRQLLAVGGLDKRLTLHSLEDPAVKTVVVERPAPITQGAISRDGSVLCVGDVTGWVGLFDVAARRRLLAAEEPLREGPERECQAGASAVIGLELSPDGARLFTMCRGGAVEMRDARSEGLPVLATLSFEANEGTGTRRLACSEALVVAAGGALLGRPSDARSRRARVWRLDDLEQAEPVTLEFGSDANAVALRPDCEGGLAVGTGDGAVRIFASCLDPAGDGGRVVDVADGSPVESLAYSPDGMLLLVGRYSGAWTLYHVETASAVGRYSGGAKSKGLISCFSPAGDMVAIDDFAGSVLLREVRPPAPVRCIALPISSSSSGGEGMVTTVLSGAAITADGTVALSSGSLLQVWEGKRLVLDTDVGEPISFNVGFANPVALRADGKRVAYGLSAGTTVQVRGWDGGGEGLTLGPWATKIFTFAWSSDGRFIAVVGAFGVAVYDGEGTQVHEFVEEGGFAMTCSFNPGGTRLATGGNSRRIVLRDTADWSVLQTLPDEGGIAHEPGGDPWHSWHTSQHRLAYGIVMSDESPNGVLVVRRVDTGEVELRVVGVNAGATTFSPDGKYILCGKLQAFPGKPMTIVSVESGAEVEWLAAFRCMALPAGDINGVTVGWRPKPDTAGAPSDDGSDELPVLLHVVVGSQFCVVDADTARHAVEDNAWGVEQLIALTESDEGDALSEVLSAAPHCVNIRHPESGDTVLHHYARERQVDAIASWLSSEEVCVTPIRNVAGHTALQVAILGQEKTIAKLLWRN
eukprot:COSAG04_NODE_1679_length_5962_cov_30.016886_3_plen_808_part_01